MNRNACMNNPYEQCFRNCPECERAIDRTPDPDYEYERYREERAEALREGLYDS